VAEHVVVEAIPGEEVGLEVAVVVQPVVGKLLRAEHQDGLVAQLVILDHRQRGEGFAKANAVGEDAAVIGFQLVDQASGGIALEVEQLLPDQAVQIAGAVVGENILVHVFEEFLEYVVEHQEVDALWRILLIDRGNVLAQARGHVFQFVRIIPYLLEQAEEHAGMGRLVEAGDDVRERIAFLVAQIDGGKALQRHVDGVAGRGPNPGKGLHRRLTTVGAEDGLATYPVGALPRDCFLGELVLQLDLELAAGEAALALGLGDMELALLLLHRVARLVGHEGRRGEDELQGLDVLQFLLQRHIGVDREARGRNLQLRARLEGAFEVFTQQAVDVVDQAHLSFWKPNCDDYRGFVLT
jgi:hypothetical protein